MFHILLLGLLAITCDHLKSKSLPQLFSNAGGGVLQCHHREQKFEDGVGFNTYI
jgi:hypothetical protein